MNEELLTLQTAHSNKRTLAITFICSVMTIAIFMLLWLSESQFGQGILRPKYLNEPCSFAGEEGRPCVAGLSCLYGKCEVPKLVIYENYSCPECQICKPCSIVKKVSYFDYNEFPNGFLKPATTGFIQDISYGGCKETCSRQDNCTALCYNDFKCFLKNSYILPPLYNVNVTAWFCAVKLY